MVLHGERYKGVASPRKAGTQQLEDEEQRRTEEPKRPSTGATCCHRPGHGLQRKSNPRGKSQITEHGSDPAHTPNAPCKHRTDLAGSSSESLQPPRPSLCRVRSGGMNKQGAPNWCGQGVGVVRGTWEGEVHELETGRGGKGAINPWY